MVKNENSANKRKRRAVADRERKRAVFSCDRCKRKKIGCKRSDSEKIIYDSSTPCIQCVTSGVECTTTAPRKRRSYYSMSDTSRYQLKCFIHLFKVMYPEKDPNNFDDLGQIAKDLETSLPGETPSGPDDSQATEYISCSDSVIERDKIMKDSKKTISGRNANASFYGLDGTPGIMKALLDLTKSDTQSETEIMDSESRSHKNSSEIKRDTYATDIQLLSLKTFPLVNLLSKIDADYYVDLFFENIHPGYFIFNEGKFRMKYEAIFKEINLNNGNFGFRPGSVLNVRREEACYIYLVWVLGIINCQHSQINNSNEILKVYLHIVKLLLGHIVISPSLDGVRSLYMAALYFETQKKRESSWLLFILASQQCVSLGFHRQSAISKYPEDIQDEIRIVWWSIFRIHMNINSSLGRFPTISIESVDIGLPKLYSIQDQLFKNYFCSSVGLFKIMYVILKHRKKLYISNDPLAIENIEQLIQIKNLLNRWHEGLSQDLVEYWQEPVKRYRLKLHLQYHYLYITLILPYLLYISRKINELDIKRLNSLVYVLCYGIKSAEALCDVIEYSDISGHSSGLLNYDLFYGYNGVMVLVLAHVLLISKNSSFSSNLKFLRDVLKKEFNVDTNSILIAINRINCVNSKSSESSKGYMKECNENIKLLIRKFGLTKVLIRINEGEVSENSISHISPRDEFTSDNIFAFKPSNAVMHGLDPTTFEIKYKQDDDDDLFENGFGFSEFERANFIFNDKYFVDSSIENSLMDPFYLS